MSKKKKSLLPKVEILIILVFFISFILWAASQCQATKKSYQEEAAIEEDHPLPTMEDEETSTPAEAKAETAPVASPPPPPPASATALSRLYVTIDGLKLRSTPSLKGDVIVEFSLFEEVYFLNEVTDFKEEINLGKELANEPWVKVKSKKGHSGWVYGAGVHYHKEKRSGVE